MKYSFFLQKKWALWALAGTFAFVGCARKGCTDPTSLNYDPEATKDDGSCQYDTSGYEVPTVYSFTNLGYSGQTVRLLLLSDLETAAEAIPTGTDVTAAQLVSIFQNTPDNYASIASGKNLAGKFLVSTANAGTQAALLDSINTWFSQLESLSATDTYYRADGVDLHELMVKTIMGGVFYDQAMNYYLPSVKDQDNSTLIPGEGTEMEHFFDEAFGYFGAPRDLGTYTDAQIISPGTHDANGDASIDPRSEQVFFFCRTAAKRDLTAASFGAASQTDFTGDLFKAFRTGRAAISNLDYVERDAQINMIQSLWDKMVAATVLHYANNTLNDLNTGAAAETLNTDWTELKGYLYILGIYPGNRLGDADLTTARTLVGNKPADISIAEINQLKTLLGDAYTFSAEQLAGW